MKKFFLVLLVLATSACSKVPAGNVGVKVYLLGGEKGVDTEVLGAGRYWLGMNEELYLFPTFTQNYVWTKDAVDEDGDSAISQSESVDESLSFQTVEGMSVNADVGISYSINPNNVSDIFQKYRKGVAEITDLYLRNMVRDALVIQASTMQIEAVYGKGKADLIAGVETRVRDQVGELGINVERIYWVGDLRLPSAVTNALNAKIAATQKAQQRENEVAQAKAEADKLIEQARGEAEALRLKRSEITESLLKLRELEVQAAAIEKWDGKLPQYSGGGAVPFIQVNK